MEIGELRKFLAAGLVIPAHPLALTAQRKLDEKHQRGLTRYYLDAGAGGIAVGVHTTQFAIRSPEHDLLPQCSKWPLKRPLFSKKRRVGGS